MSCDISDLADSVGDPGGVASGENAGVGGVCAATRQGDSESGANERRVWDGVVEHSGATFGWGLFLTLRVAFGGSAVLRGFVAIVFCLLSAAIGFDPQDLSIELLSVRFDTGRRRLTDRACLRM